MQWLPACEVATGARKAAPLISRVFLCDRLDFGKKQFYLIQALPKLNETFQFSFTHLEKNMNK